MAAKKQNTSMTAHRGEANASLIEDYDFIDDNQDASGITYDIDSDTPDEDINNSQ